MCLLLAGCTPKEEKTVESGTLPGIANPDVTGLPEPTSAPENQGDTPAEPDGPEATDPEETSGEEVAVTEPVEDSLEGLTPSEIELIEQILESENEGGIEVEEEYTVDIGENVAVGGN